jgi:ABC-2 type transport system permease protein
MRQILPVIKKELRSYFNSPIAFIVVVFFLAFTAAWLFLVQKFIVMNVASLRSYFGIMPVVFIILIPALTMRSWAEERRAGTEELLLTLPFTEFQVVTGKFLAAAVLMAVMIVLTIPVPLALSPLGTFEFGQIVAEYIGVLLLGFTGIAIGQFISSLSRNQIAAFIFSALVLMVLTLVGTVTRLMSLPDWISSLFNYISLDYHFESFKKGILDTRDLLYFIILTLFFIYLNVKVLKFRKWK